ncbi:MULTISPECIES: ABC transporter substrate-binding protein [unclassified Rhizobium]|uniref:glycine betaine ABC transporter substrate-binding protein OsmF n=1 Tax=unclassified Rhizobium TaxID=2613769 RepID=UPI001ADD3F5B|nr:MULTISPECIES: ABC transporter substrate-binding protein [unclassified Rhizobium]MBO9122551.1 ABC transporter substrate-binding protein [Rhizobium sp. 16-488-2b]MBO9173082.1 ABC transporter substrate-binding protein [Rhizobium sp. 16-488-2a]
MLKRIVLAVSLCALTAGAVQAADVVVSSKIDTEGTLLGNVIALALNANGIKTKDRIALGATPVLRKAITAGEIDIYPEYTGNAGFFFNKPDDAAWKNIQQGYDMAKKLDYDANRIVWLTPSPANNTWAIAVRNDVAGKNNLKSMSDFGKWVAGGGEAKLVASAEFVNTAGALPAFQTTYGFTLKPEQEIVLSGGDTAATIKAAADQTNGANSAMVYGTDGAIEAAELTVLEDDKSVQQVYAPTPIIREEVLKANPKIEEILAPIFQSLTADELRKLNGKIQVDGEPAKSVAEAYLKEKGFLK